MKSISKTTGKKSLLYILPVIFMSLLIVYGTSLAFADISWSALSNTTTNNLQFNLFASLSSNVTLRTYTISTNESGSWKNYSTVSIVNAVLPLSAIYSNYTTGAYTDWNDSNVVTGSQCDRPYIFGPCTFIANYTRSPGIQYVDLNITTSQGAASTISVYILNQTTDTWVLNYSTSYTGVPYLNNITRYYFAVSDTLFGVKIYNTAGTVSPSTYLNELNVIPSIAASSYNMSYNWHNSSVPYYTYVSWRVYFNDTDSYSNYTDIATFYYFDYPSNLDIQTPVNGSYDIITNVTEYPLNYTFYSTNASTYGASSCKFSLNGMPNISLGACLNTSITLNQTGNYTLNLYSTANTTGIVNTSTVGFRIDFSNRFDARDVFGALVYPAYVVFDNSTDTMSNTSLTGIFYINTSDFLRGNVTATFSSPNYISSVQQYYVDNRTSLNQNISLINTGMTIKVRGEDTLSPIPWWKLTMTNNSVGGNGSYTTYITAGKGIIGGSSILFLDDSSDTGVTNSDVNFTYNFGFTNATFNVIYDVIGSTTNVSNITIRAWNKTAGSWVTVFSVINSTNKIKTTGSFNIDNGIGNSIYGDMFQSCLGYNCPLFELDMTPEAGANITVYDVKLVYPFNYDSNGYATLNYTDFQLVIGTSRFVFQSAYSGFNYLNSYGLRTYFVTPSYTNNTILNAYLNPSCYMQQFYVQDASSMASGNAIPIPGALMSIYRQIGDTSYLVDQQTSDGAGIARLCVEAGFSYRMVTIATGYQSQSLSDQVFSNTGQQYYVRLSSTSAQQAVINPYYFYLNVTPSGGEISMDPPLTCNAYAPMGNALGAYFRVWLIRSNSSYPNSIKNNYTYMWPSYNESILNYTAFPYLFNFYNYSDRNYPPNYTIGNGTVNTDPFGLNTTYVTLFANYTSSDPHGMGWTINMVDTGSYFVQCGLMLNPINISLPYFDPYQSGGSFGGGRSGGAGAGGSWSNATNYTVLVNYTMPFGYGTQNMIRYYNDTGTVMGAGQRLRNYIGMNSMYIVILILDMIITGFFVTRFGMRSAFMFLLIWGLMLTVLGGWGLSEDVARLPLDVQTFFPNPGTGIFIVGVLFWLALVLFPYRRSE